MPCSHLAPRKLISQDFLSNLSTATRCSAVVFTPQPQWHEDSHWGPKDSESSEISLPGDSGLLERTQTSSRTLPGSWAGGCAWRLSFLPVGLFQKLVLICGDPHHLMPCAKWHLPSASAAELPLAHELSREQVSETMVKKKLMAFQGEAQHG